MKNSSSRSSSLLHVFILQDCIFNSFRALLVLASAASLTLHDQPAILQLISDVQSDWEQNPVSFFFFYPFARKWTFNFSGLLARLVYFVVCVAVQNNTEFVKQNFLFSHYATLQLDVSRAEPQTPRPVIITGLPSRPLTYPPPFLARFPACTSLSRRGRSVCHLGHNIPIMKRPDSVQSYEYDSSSSTAGPFSVWTITMQKPLFKVFFSLLLHIGLLAAPVSSFSRGFCASSRRPYFTLTALLRYGTVKPPRPAVSSLLHNKRAPFRDYTVQEANSGVGLSLSLFVCRTTSPVNEHRSNPSSFIAELHHKDDVFQRISE